MLNHGKKKEQVLYTIKIEQAKNGPLTYTEAILQLYACNFSITHRLIKCVFCCSQRGDPDCCLSFLRQGWF